MFQNILALKIEFFSKFTSQNLTGGSFWKLLEGSRRFWMIMEGVSHTKSGIFSKFALCTDHGLWELTLNLNLVKNNNNCLWRSAPGGGI